jgi:hypothetical protein
MLVKLTTEIEKKKNASTKSKNGVYLKRVNGESSNEGSMTKEILFEILTQYNQTWDDKTKTLVYPLMPDPPYCGPLGLSIVSDSTENKRIANLRGFTNEMKVLHGFKDQTKPYKLFSGIKIKGAKLNALASVFGYQGLDLSDIREVKKSISGKAISAKDDFEIEMDLVAIGNQSIHIIEIKSDSTEHTIWVSKQKISFISYLSHCLLTTCCLFLL